MCIYACMYICVYTCILYLCIYVYMYIHTYVYTQIGRSSGTPGAIGAISATRKYRGAVSTHSLSTHPRISGDGCYGVRLYG